LERNHPLPDLVWFYGYISIAQTHTDLAPFLLMPEPQWLLTGELESVPRVLAD